METDGILDRPKLSPRDYISVSKIDHKTSKAVSKGMDLSTLFSDSGACMLMPSVDQGPLCKSRLSSCCLWLQDQELMPPSDVQGEEVRKNITGGEKGIPLTLAIQVVDYKTCQTVPNAYVDIWSSNSTVSALDLLHPTGRRKLTDAAKGIYVGVQGYPGMGDPKDASILKGTTLRGVQPTNDHGVASFDSLFPGHYDGRATHIHGNTSPPPQPSP